MFRADGSDGEDEPQVSVHDAIHRDGERSVTVSSRHEPAASLRSKWHSVGPDIRVRPSEWRSVRIPVDGDDRDFDLAADGPWWVAVADLGEVAVMIRAHHVEVSEVRLVTIDRPAVRPMRRLGRPSPRDRVFPARFDPVPGPANVDFTLRNGRVFTGTVGSQPVEVVLSGRWSPSVRGRIGTTAVAADLAYAGGRRTVAGALVGRRPCP